MKYKRVVVSRFGGPEVLHIVEDEIPEPQFGEVRVKVLAAGVAWGDILRREGFGIGVRPPFTPGYDIVGTVDGIGDGVSTVGVGQMVAALPVLGGYAEFVCLPASELVHAPSGLDPAEAVCLVMNYVAAHQMLHRAACVKPGERILVHSAGGGVGTALLQLGKLAALEIYGTASSGKHDLISDLGAIPIDYHAENFVERIFALTGEGVNAVFDPIGGGHVWQSYRALRKGGRLVVFGSHTVIEDGMFKLVWGSVWSSFLNLIPDQKTLLSYNLTRPKYSSPEWIRSDLTMLFGLLAQGRIKPVIAERTPLVEAARAHELLRKGRLMGKIVLICNT